MGNGRAGVNCPIDHSRPFAIFWSIPKKLSVIVIPPLFFGGGRGAFTVSPPPPPDLMALCSDCASHLHFGYLPTLLTLDNGGPRPHGFTTKICRCLKCWFWIQQTLVNRLSCLKKISCIQSQSLRSVLALFYVARSPVKTAMSTFVFKGTSNCSKERSLILQITCSERRGIWIVK